MQHEEKLIPVSVAKSDHALHLPILHSIYHSVVMSDHVLHLLRHGVRLERLSLADMALARVDSGGNLLL